MYQVFILSSPLSRGQFLCLRNTPRGYKELFKNVVIFYLGEDFLMPVSTDNKALIIRIAEIIISELKLEDITAETFDPDLDLVDELGVDSMDLATVVLVLQDEYGITIDEDDYPKLRNVRMIAEYIEHKKTV